MEEGAPSPEPQRRGTTRVVMEFPTFDAPQPRGALPPPMTDSPSVTPCSARPSGMNSFVVRAQTPDLKEPPAHGADTSGGCHDVRGGRDSAMWVPPSARGDHCMSPPVGPNSCSGFREKLEALSATHDLEVADLKDEVEGLQGLVVQYKSLLDKVQGHYKRIHGELLCAASDEPAMSDLMHQIAGQMFSECLWEESPCSAWKTSCRPSETDAGAPKRVTSRVTLPAENTRGLELRISSQAVAAMPPAAARAYVDDVSRRRKKIKATKSMIQRTRLQRLVDHTVFDLFCAFMIVSNSVVIGYEVQWLTTSDTEPAMAKIMGWACTVFFFFELVLRVLADGAAYFFIFSELRNWNWFDFGLVAMSLIDIVMLLDGGGQASSIGMGLKTIKIFKIIRVVRVFRFFTKLSQLALMIIDSVRSLVWALIMLGIVVYIFAIFFTHYAAEHVRLQGKSSSSIVIQDHFGSLWTTLYTLFHCMLNGISWYVLPAALYSIPGLTGPLLAAGFVGYLSFTMLAVMNIITGVFVDNAVETARHQREFLVQKEMEVKEQWLKEMRSIFGEMDSDNSGTVSKDEISEFCNDERVTYYMTALGLDVHDTERLFELLDENRDGELEVDEFLAGCLRLKGMARSIDLYTLIHQTRQLCKRIDEIDKSLQGKAGLRRATTSAWLMAPLSSSPGQKSFSTQEPVSDDTLADVASAGN